MNCRIPISFTAAEIITLSEYNKLRDRIAYLLTQEWCSGVVDKLTDIYNGLTIDNVQIATQDLDEILKQLYKQMENERFDGAYVLGKYILLGGVMVCAIGLISDYFQPNSKNVGGIKAIGLFGGVVGLWFMTVGAFHLEF